MKCVILQPAYIPWRGYFHQIYKADVFVFYDAVQYDRHGWRNRNRVKTPAGAQWLTIPVLSKGSHTRHIPIHEIEICWDKAWSLKHWRTLQQHYHRAPHFHRYSRLLEEFYNRRPRWLADFTIGLCIALAHELGIHTTRFIRSSSLGVTGRQTDRLLAILNAVGATHYISGPSAQSYLEEQKLTDAGIALEYMVYDYSTYPQLYPPFDPYVSILDLLFMTGPQAPGCIWGEPAAQLCNSPDRLVRP